jgi:hypothetical protein
VETAAVEGVDIVEAARVKDDVWVPEETGGGGPPGHGVSKGQYIGCWQGGGQRSGEGVDVNFAAVLSKATRGKGSSLTRYGRERMMGIVEARFWGLAMLHVTQRIGRVFAADWAVSRAEPD